MNTDVKCGIIEASSNELLYQIEVHKGLIPAYIVKKHDGPIPYIHKYTSHGPVCGRFFFSLWYGRSRSKARSLHETKLLVRKLLHGRRWSHEAWQIITRKTTHTQTAKNWARRRIPSQICVLPSQDSEANSKRGKAQQKQPQKICQGHSGENPLCRKLKNMQQTN